MPTDAHRAGLHAQCALCPVYIEPDDLVVMLMPAHQLSHAYHWEDW